MMRNSGIVAAISLISLICVLPLTTVLVLSASTSLPGHPWLIVGITTLKYRALVHYAPAGDAFLNSIGLSIPVGLLSGLLAFFCALALWRMTARVLLYPILFVTPFIPGVLDALSFSAVERLAGMKEASLFVLITCLTLWCLPFATMIVLASMASIPEGILISAADLGASTSHTISAVLFRLVAPSVVSASLVSSLLALNEYDRVAFLSGGRQFLSQFMESQFAGGVDPAVYGLAMLSIITVVVAWCTILLGWHLSKLRTATRAYSGPPAQQA
jgi:ABC-type spermidine/putrescine transport system permease subunit II